MLMWKYAFLFVLTVATAMTGCRKGSSENYALTNDSVAWERISQDEPIPYPNGFIATDTSLIVLGVMDECWLHEYSNETGTLNRSFVTVGGGPDDLTNATFVAAKTDSTATIFDSGRQQLVEVSLSDGRVVNRTSWSELKRPVWGAWPIGKGRLVIKSPKANADGRPIRTFLLVDVDKMEVLSEFDSWPDELNDPMVLITQSELTITPDNQQFVTATTVGDIFEVMKINGDSIKSVKAIVTNSEMPSGEKPVVGYPSLISTENEIIGSYAGSKDEKDAKKLRFFDHDGNITREIATDAMVLKLAIDKSGTIFAVINTDEDGLQLAKIAKDK